MLRTMPETTDHNRPVFDQLHPRIYGFAAALVLWFVVSAWVFFGHGGYTSLSLTFVTVLLFIAVVLPWVLSRAWRKSQLLRSQEADAPSFRDWRSGDLTVWGSRLRNMHAAIDVLLPLMAVAFGLTAIGIVFAIERAAT
jgi:hypothetical protein